VGESGCGKTTTGRCAQMLYKPTAGQIFFDGVDMTCLKEEEIRRFEEKWQ
jgi:ABC-type oligopeptide transport system ATPase subunit